MVCKSRVIDVRNIGDKYIYFENGRYRVEIALGYNRANGKRERFVKRVATKSEAITVRNAKIEEINANQITADENMTFLVLAKDYLLKHESDIAQSTLDTYKRSLNNYILPVMCNMKIKDIKSDYLTDFYDYLRNEYEQKTSDKIGLSDVTIAHIHSTIRAILNHAVTEGYITKNVANKLKNAPSLDVENPRQAYTPKEVNKIYQLLDNENLRFRAIVKVALSGCLRRGEISGLNWSDIDKDKNKIEINRSVTGITGKGLVIKEPKTKKSKASVSVSQDTIDSLYEYKSELELLGFEITNDTPVFLSSNGKRLSPDKISAYWKRFVSKNDIPKYCFHSLRHTGLSLMYMGSGNIVAVSKHARHSRVSTTSDIYLHSSPKQDEELVNVLENIRNDPTQALTQREILEQIQSVLAQVNYTLSKKE